MPDDAKDFAGFVPLAGTLGIQISTATPEEVRGWMAWAPELCTTGGVLHGGAIMALADTVASACAFLNLADGTITSTIEAKTNFLRAVTSGSVEAVARPLHVGRSTIVLQTEVFDQDGRRVAHTTQTQAVRAPAG